MSDAPPPPPPPPPPTPPATPSPANMPPKATATPPASPSEPIQLPDDHPLVKAFQAQKDLIKDLKQRVEPKSPPKPATPAAPADDPVQAQLDELRQQLEAEKTAREQADQKAAAAALANLRAKRIAQHDNISAAAADKLSQVLTGTDEASIDKEIEDWLPLLATAGQPGVPRPNQQQGKPPGTPNGSLASGRERYKTLHGSKT